jgi:hypothetical protein
MVQWLEVRRREIQVAQVSKRTCDLPLTLLRSGGIELRYDAKDGLRRCLSLTGRVNDPQWSYSETQGGAPFHGKRVRVDILSPVSKKWLKQLRARLGLADACGEVVVEAGVEPKQEGPPITVIAELGTEAFTALFQQAFDEHRRFLYMKLILAGNSLPETKGSMWLNDLDVSCEQHYAIAGMEISFAQGAPITADELIGGEYLTKTEHVG